MARIFKEIAVSQKKKRRHNFERLLFSHRLLPRIKRSFLRNQTTVQDSPVFKEDDNMDNHRCRCCLANQFDSFFQWEVLKLTASSLGCWGWTRPSRGSLGPCRCAAPSPGSLILGDAWPRAQGGLWDSSNVPWHPTLWGNCKLCNVKLPRNLQKREFFLAGRETTVYKLEIYVLTFDFLLLKRTSGLRLAWAQLLVVYIGYWLFTLGQYTGRAVYTRPATNSTAWSVSTAAALLYLQSWKEIKNRLWK